MTESKEKLKRLLMRVKEESEKDGLKLYIRKIKIMTSSHHFMANRWGNSGKSGKSDRLYFLGSKSLQMGTAAIKLKEGKL